MIDLQKLIIDRITLIKQIPTTISAIIEKQTLPSVQAQNHTNRNVLKCINLIKNKQRQRIKSEGALLEEIKGLKFFNQSIIEEVFNVSRSVFYLYNQDLQRLISKENSISEKLRLLYKTFFEKQQTRISAKHINQILQNQIIELTPFILLGWTCQWSRNLLHEKIQQISNEQYIRHNEQQQKNFNCALLRQSSDAATKRIISNPTQFSVSTCIIKNQQRNLLLTNKQSVFGLFLDQLLHYYKTLPASLQIDFTFLKSMRKVHYKGSIFDNQENLQKAVLILIQSKNKHIKEAQEQYRSQCMSYLNKNPDSLSKNYMQKIQILNPENSVRRRKLKKLSKKMNGLQRIKSQSKEQHYRPYHQNSLDSYLLHPKTNEISFDSSKEMKNIPRQKQQKIIELPLITKRSNKHIKNRKAANNYAGTVHKSLMANYENSLLKSHQISPKIFTPKDLSLEPLTYINQMHKFFKNKALEQNKKEELGLLVRRESQQFRQNRKFMLQLLRQKNKNLIYDK